MKKFRLTAILITLIMCFSAVGVNAATVKEVVPFTDFSTAPAFYSATTAKDNIFIAQGKTTFENGVMNIKSKTDGHTSTGVLIGNLDNTYKTNQYKQSNDTYKTLFRKYTHVISMDITVESVVSSVSSDDSYMALMGATTTSSGLNSLGNTKSTLLAVAKGESENTWKLMLNTTQKCMKGKSKVSDISGFAVPTGYKNLSYNKYVNVKIVFGSKGAYDYMTFYVDNKFYGAVADSAVPATGAYNLDDERLAFMSALRFRVPKTTNEGDIIVGIDNLSWLAYEGTYDAALSASADDITVADGTASTTARIITPTAMPNKKTYMAVLAEYDSNGMVRCDMGKVSDAAYENTIPLSLGSADGDNRFAAYVMEYDRLKPILATPATLN